MVTRMARGRTARSTLAARRAGSGSVRAGMARAGLAARGAMYILVGVIAVQVALGDSRQQADKDGAVRLVAGTPFGSVILWLLVIGFAGMTFWQLSSALWGGDGADGRKASRRLGNLGCGAFYALVTYGILKFALGIGAPASSDKQSQDLTAAALKVPGGQVLVTVAGLVVVAAGACLAYLAYERAFLKHLRMGRASAAARKAVTRLGQVGGIARGVVFVTVGIFLIVAALEAKPSQAKGIDSALRALAHTPLGLWLLVAVAVGLVIFGVYSWCEARWRAV
jgi:hypothetical protein